MTAGRPHICVKSRRRRKIDCRRPYDPSLRSWLADWRSRPGQKFDVGAYVRERREIAITHHCHHHHHGGADERARASGESRPGQVRRNAVHNHLRELPSQPARPREGQVQLDAVVLLTAALHEQRRLGAGAHRLSAVGRCPSRQDAIPATCEERARAVAASAGVRADALVSRFQPRSEPRAKSA